MSDHKGKRRDVNKVIGATASTEMKIGTQIRPWEYIMKKAMLNATIMLAMEINSVTSPHISFIGNDMKKSSSA